MLARAADHVAADHVLLVDPVARGLGVPPAPDPDVAAGDAVLLDDIIVARYGRRPGLTAVADVGTGSYAIGVRRDENDLLRAVDEALTLGAPCLVLVVGGLPKDRDGTIRSKDLQGAREMARDGIGELLEYARPAGMPLAIEPLHPMYAADRACVNTMAHANALCDELGAGVGIAVDAYHVWWDPNLEREIERAGDASRLLAYHICDWLVPTTDLLTDRGMMGDGVIDLPLLRSWMERAAYRGMHEVEIFSANNWWKRDPDEVLMIVKARHREAS